MEPFPVRWGHTEAFVHTYDQEGEGASSPSTSSDARPGWTRSPHDRREPREVVNQVGGWEGRSMQMRGACGRERGESFVLFCMHNLVGLTRKKEERETREADSGPFVVKL